MLASAKCAIHKSPQIIVKMPTIYANSPCCFWLTYTGWNGIDVCPAKGLLDVTHKVLNGRIFVNVNFMIVL